MRVNCHTCVLIFGNLRCCVQQEEKQDELVAQLESLTLDAETKQEQEQEQVSIEDLASLTVAELKAKAKALGIDAPKKKADLIAAIEAASAAPVAATTDVAEDEEEVEDQQLLDFIDRCDFLSFNENRRVVCTLTGHEMKPRFSIVRRTTKMLSSRCT